MTIAGREVFATILITDLVGFTEFSRRQKAEETFELLQEYFSFMDRITTKNSGVVDKTMGDGLLCYFASKGNDRAEQKYMASKAAKAAIDMKIATSYMNSKIYENGFSYSFPEKDLKTVIHSGKIWKGEILKSKKEETIIGPTVNLTSRIEGLVPRAKSFDTQPVAVNQITCNLIQSDHYWQNSRGNLTPFYTSKRVKGFGDYELILYELLNKKETINDILLPKEILNKKMQNGYGPFDNGMEVYIDYQINPKEYDSSEKAVLQLPLLVTEKGRYGDSQEWEVEFYLKDSSNKKVALSKRGGVTFNEPKPHEYAPCVDLKEKQEELKKQHFSFKDYLVQNEYKLRVFFFHTNDGHDRYWIQGIDSNRIRRIYWGIVYI